MKSTTETIEALWADQRRLNEMRATIAWFLLSLEVFS